MYCKPATAAFIAQQRREGNDGLFYAAKPLGVNMIAKYMKEAAGMMGLPGNFRPHCLRSVCITRLANDPGVSESELLGVARHNSVAASRNYMVTDSASETKRLAALGIAVEAELQKEAEASKEKKRKLEQLEECSQEMEYVSLSQRHESDDEDVGDVSMTQVGIGELQDSIERLRVEMSSGKMVEDDRKPAALSENQLMIQKLKEEVEKEERRGEDVKINERDCRGRVSEIEVGCVLVCGISESRSFGTCPKYLDKKNWIYSLDYNEWKALPQRPTLWVKKADNS